MANKILLLTTVGCRGCQVAEQNIRKAITATVKHIDFEVTDWHDMRKSFLMRYKIKDYPTVVYMSSNPIQGDIVLAKFTGSYPVVCYSRWIDIHFTE